MLLYNIKIGIRNILRQKVYSFINIFGLAIGICIFILIGLYVNNEYSYDRFNPNHDRVVRMEFFDWCVIPPGVGHLMNNQLADIEKICRYTVLFNKILIHDSDDVKFKNSVSVKTGGLVDSTFFDVFGVKLLSGDKKNCLLDPNSIIITNSLAKKMFGDKNPINKIINFENLAKLKVTGVLDDSENFHMMADYYIPLSIFYKVQGKAEMESLRSWNYLTYLLLKNKNYDKSDLQNKIFNFLKEQDKNRDLITKGWNPTDIVIRKLTDIYFFKEAHAEAGVLHGNKPVVKAFVIIAIFIILIALINFINITTARAAIRAREVGVKKVVGATRKRLIRQFITESLIISFAAMLLGLTFLQILLPEFNNLTNTNLQLQDSVFSIYGIIGIILLTLFIGLLAGIYPALYLSLFKTMKVLKGEVSRGKSAGKFRVALIVFQFIIATILISGTIIVNKQINYIKNKDLGFNKENLLHFVLKDKLFQTKKEFKSKLLENPNIKGVSFSHGTPGYTRNTNTMKWVDDVDPIETRVSSGDPDFVEALGIKIIEGRNFDWNLETDKRKTCIINKTLADMIGLDNPIGHKVNDKNNSWIKDASFSIIGVFKDYHLESLHTVTPPMAIFWSDQANFQGSIKISSNNIKETMKYIEEVWNEFVPGFPFEYDFADQRFDKMYKGEERTQKITVYFSILAIFIACLGLFGLSAFMTQRRFKEIGIRKVLGSSISQIVSKLSKEFAIIVLISNIIAIPLAWFVLDSWLQDYPYRISVPWWPFPIAFIITLVTALLTVSFHSLKAALSNPVDAIRYE